MLPLPIYCKINSFTLLRPSGILGLPYFCCLWRCHTYINWNVHTTLPSTTLQMLRCTIYWLYCIGCAMLCNRVQRSTVASQPAFKSMKSSGSFIRQPVWGMPVYFKHCIRLMKLSKVATTNCMSLLLGWVLIPSSPQFKLQTAHKYVRHAKQNHLSQRHRAPNVTLFECVRAMIVVSCIVAQTLWSLSKAKSVSVSHGLVMPCTARDAQKSTSKLNVYFDPCLRFLIALEHDA